MKLTNRYTKLDNNGFGAIVPVVALLVIAVVLGGGWLVLRAQSESARLNNADQNIAQDSVPPKAQDSTAQNEAAVVKQGAFTGIGSKTGSGTASLVKNADNTYTVRFEEDFVVQNGPALYVSFANDGKVDHDTLFAELKSFEGKQEYAVPQAIDVSKYDQVMIYCEEFSVAFSVATLQ